MPDIDDKKKREDERKRREGAMNEADNSDTTTETVEKESG